MNYSFDLFNFRIFIIFHFDMLIIFLNLFEGLISKETHVFDRLEYQSFKLFFVQLENLSYIDVAIYLAA